MILERYNIGDRSRRHIVVLVSQREVELDEGALPTTDHAIHFESEIAQDLMLTCNPGVETLRPLWIMVLLQYSLFRSVSYIHSILSAHITHFPLIDRRKLVNILGRSLLQPLQQGIIIATIFIDIEQTIFN